jgi:hypothetical protein
MKSTALLIKPCTIFFSGVAVFALVFGSLWLTPATAAFAATGTPPAKPTPSYTGLKDAYQREQSWLSQQSDHLAKANGVAATVQAFIAKEQGLGLDTSELTAALSTYQSQVASAQSSHDTAGGILSNHAGFDANGNVTDADQARLTVTSARQALSDAHNMLVQASHDLRAALDHFRDTKGLENRLQREQKWLSEQQTHLDDANKVAGQVQTYINNQNAEGHDTSALVAALATFHQQLITAQASHTAAANLLSAHAGFDANGNVTDPTQARQTLVDAHQALLDAHKVLRQGGEDLHKALQEYREKHKSAPAPTATPGA